MSEAIWIAIIGAAAIIIAAIIGGIFMYISREKKKNSASNPTINTKIQNLEIERGKFKEGISQKGNSNEQSLKIKKSKANSVNQENR